MKKILTRKWPFLFLIVALFLSACRGEDEKVTQDEEIATETVVHQIPLPKNEFRKVIGWTSPEEVVVHAGDTEGDSLYLFNIFTGAFDQFYESDSFILTADIIREEKKMIIQLVKDANSSLVVMDLTGKVLQQKEIESNGFADLNVNQQNPNSVFVSYYVGENDTAVYHWDISTNEYTSVESTSLNPQWYSEHLYLFVDNGDDFSLETGKLYMGDIRTGDVLLLNAQVSEFYLHEDTFISFTSSDFNNQEILLSYQYPFLVDVGFMIAPKITLNGRINFPHLTQAERDSAIYGVFAKESVALELETGQFEFGKLNFETGQIEPIIEVPENIPISISENGQYCLIGWGYERLIDIENQRIHPLTAL